MAFFDDGVETCGTLVNFDSNFLFLGVGKECLKFRVIIVDILENII